MKILKKIWRDITKGENIDLYITVVVAFGIGIMSIFGYADLRLTTAIVLAALGILTSSALRDKHAHEEVISQNLKVFDEIKKLDNSLNENLQRTITARSNESKILQKLSDSTKEVLEKITVSHSIIESGLQEIVMQPRNIYWDILFENTNEIDVFFTYARTWRNTNNNLLDQFVRKSGRRLRVILPDPENEVLLKELSNRFSKSTEEFRNLIEESTREYRKFHDTGQNYGAKVELWHASITPMFTLYRFDNIGILALGSYKSTKGDVPHFICEMNGSLFKYAKEEFDVLIGNDGRLISKKIF